MTYLASSHLFKAFAYGNMGICFSLNVVVFFVSEVQVTYSTLVKGYCMAGELDKSTLARNISTGVVGNQLQIHDI